MAEVIAVVGAIASFGQLVTYVHKCNESLRDSPVVSERVQQQAKTLLGLAESIKANCAADFDNSLLGGFNSDCTDLYTISQELCKDSTITRNPLVRMRALYLWKTRKRRLEDCFERLQRTIIVLNFEDWVSRRSPGLMGAAVSSTLWGGASASRHTSVTNMPSCHTPFVGYSDELKLLVDRFMPLDTPRSIALVGLPGTGKSRLARECGQQIQSLCPECSVFWLDARSEASFEDTLLDLAMLADIGSGTTQDSRILNQIRTYLNLNASKCFLIVDGLNEADTLWGKRRFRDMLPTCNTLFTTRDKHLIRHLVGEEDLISLRGLNLDDAKQLLVGEALNIMQDAEELTCLLAAIACTPSAIKHARAYMLENKVTPRIYCEKLWTQPSISLELYHSQIRHMDGLTGESSARTFELLHQNIKERLPLAAEVLHMTAFFYSNAIPRQLIEMLYPEPELVKALGMLDALCLLERDQKRHDRDCFNLCQSAQSNLRARARRLQTGRTLHQKAVQVLLTVLPDKDGSERASQFALHCLPHGQELLLEYGTDQSGESSVDHTASSGTLAFRVAALLKAQGRYRSSVQFAQMAVNLLIEAQGSEAKETLRARSILYEGMGLLGNLEEAEKQWWQLWDDTKTLYSQTDPDAIAMINNLAIVLRERSRFDEAEKLYQDVLALESAIQGREESRMKTRHNRAITLQDLERYDEAKELYDVVLEWQENNAESVSEVWKLSTVNNIGTFYHVQQQWEPARKMYERSFIGSTNLLGEAHPDTIMAQTNMACVLEAQGELATAEYMARRAAEHSEKSLGSEHPYTISALKLLGRLLHLLTRYVESEAITRKAYEASLEALGPENEESIALRDQADQLRDWILLYKDQEE